MQDNEPTLSKIDDYEKPMPKEKKRMLTKIGLYIMLAIAVYLTLTLLLG